MVRPIGCCATSPAVCRTISTWSIRPSNSSPPGTPSTRSTLIAKPASAAVEDYLKVIYAHTEWQDAPITGSQLAARLGLVPSTVTEMVKKLASAGLVSHEPYGAITLTGEGRAQALRMVRRHRLVETWLVEGFGYGWHEVHDEAEVLEHVLSDRLLDAIDAQLGHPVRDPHGDPIPASDGTVSRPDAVLATELDAAARGRVARISDRDPEVLRRIEEAGVSLDDVVTAGELPPGAGELVWLVPLDGPDGLGGSTA